MTKSKVIYKLLTGSLLFSISVYLPTGLLFDSFVLLLISYLITYWIGDNNQGFLRQVISTGIFIFIFGAIFILLFILLKAGYRFITLG